MQIEFTPRNAARGYGLPDARLVNMLVEATPGGPGSSARLSRPGLVSALQPGAGPLRGLFSDAGNFGGQLFSVSGSSAYLGISLLGSVGAGTDLARSAASTNQRVIVVGMNAYLYDPSVSPAFAQIVSPNLPPCVDVLYFDSTFVYLTATTDGRFYYSLPDDAANIDGLAFEAAEMKPDGLVGGLVVGDLFYLFGTASVEPWFATGDLNTPFEREVGRAYNRGCAARDTIRLVDNTAFWLGNDRVVYRAGVVPERISDHDVEGLLQACTNIAGCTAIDFTFEGHPLYVLNVPGQGSRAYDVSLKEWAVWESYGRTPAVFRGRVATMLGDLGPVYIGDDTTNDVWTPTKGVFQDGAAPLVREATAFIPVPGGRPRCDRIALSAARGTGLNGQAPPVVEMAYSDDQSKTWSRWRQGTFGTIGEYDHKVYWNRLGRMKAPGRVLRFRTSDPVLATFADIQVNGGRP